MSRLTTAISASILSLAAGLPSHTLHAATATALSPAITAALAASPAAASHDFTLDLGGQRFDPLINPPAASRGWERRGDAGHDLRLVQFNGPIQPEWLTGL